MGRKRVVVLGGGMVGGFMARTLALDERLSVTLCDRDQETLLRSARVQPMELRRADLSDPAAVAACVAEADVVVGAVPGHMGYRTAEAVLRAGRHYVDISFFPEDPSPLDALAKERGLTAVVDCGVMPGLGGMLGVHLSRAMDEAQELTIMVGGLPVERRWPTEYKAPFSPIDVIEEYTRPARYRDRGQLVVRPAMSEPELVDLPGVGTLEAFNTDGLRTLLTTLDIPTMREKTLRYPGHIEKMRFLSALGFFSAEPLQIAGQAVRPLDLTAELLFREWRLTPGTPELTVMRVEVAGRHEGRSVVRRADLLDRTDPARGDSSMARTTGFPAVIVATLVTEGLLDRPGLTPAEVLAFDARLFETFLERLMHAGVKIEFDL